MRREERREDEKEISQHREEESFDGAVELVIGRSLRHFMQMSEDRRGGGEGFVEKERENAVCENLEH